MYSIIIIFEHSVILVQKTKQSYKVTEMRTIIQIFIKIIRQIIIKRVLFKPVIFLGQVIGKKQLICLGLTMENVQTDFFSNLSGH